MNDCVIFVVVFMSIRSPVRTRSHLKRVISTPLSSKRINKRGRFSQIKNMTPNPEKEKESVKLQHAQQQIDKLNNDLLQLQHNHRLQIDQYNVEINNLRLLTKTQNDQLQGMRKQLAEVPVNNNNQQFFQTLIDGMRAIHIEVKPPKFRDAQNPQVFIEKLDKYFKIKHISLNERLEYLDDVFDGNEKLWFETQTFADYASFKKKFIEEFYSVAVRVRIKADWHKRKFDPSKDQLNSYFLNQVKDAQYFTPQMENYELHYTIIQQLPMRIREILSAVDFADFEKICQVLSQLDITFRDKQESSKRGPLFHGDRTEEKRGESRGNQSRGGEGRPMQGGSQQQSNNRGNFAAKVVTSNIGMSPGRAESNSHYFTNFNAEEEKISLPNLSIPPPTWCNHGSQGAAGEDFDSVMKNNISNVELSRCYDYHDFDSLSRDLLGGESGKVTPSCHIPLCPRVTLSIFSVPMKALVDTGSQITAISESYYAYLKQHGNFVILPVTNIRLFTAIGKKPTVIKKQVACDVRIDGRKISSQFLVVPNLSNDMIIGNDWLLKNRVVIDYDKLGITVDGIELNNSAIQFGNIVEKHADNKSDDPIMYIQVLEVCDISRDFGMTLGGEIGGEINGGDQIMRNSRASKTDDESLSVIDTSRVQETSVQERANNVNKEHVLSKNHRENIYEYDQEIDPNFVDFIDAGEYNKDYSREIESFKEIGICQEGYISRIDVENTFLRDVEVIASEIPGITEREREVFAQVMSKFEYLFSEKNCGAKVTPYQIRVKPHKVPVFKTYSIPIAHRKKVSCKIQKMLEARVIEKCNVSYCNPIRIVIKSDGTVRICLDARFINVIIESDHEAPPLVYELLQKFQGISYLSTTDLATGYWQIPLHPDSRKYTAFLYDSQMYQFCRLPFGLKTAGSVFIRSLHEVLGNQFEETLTIYIDDFLITTKGNFYNHIYEIEKIFTVLQENNFTLNLDKSLFGKKEVKFLGHELSVDGVKPRQDKLELIQKFEKPRNRTELQRFIGMCTYYRQFTVKHAILLEPFRSLLKEKNFWDWTPQHDRAFENMKLAFINCVQLDHYLPGKQFRLQTDASDLGISGILYQVDDLNELRVVALVSRCLAEAELHYTTTEKELLAIVYAVMKLRIYLLGTRFVIITDHKGLTFLNSTPYLNSRLIRWSLLLQQYDFEVEYCKGSDNVVADFFSRNPRGKFESVVQEGLSIDVLLVESQGVELNGCSGLTLTSDLTHDLKNLEALQREDENIRSIIQKVKNKELSRFFVVEEHILFRFDQTLKAWQIVIPEVLTRRIVDCIHTKLGHPGVFKTGAYIRQYYYWKSMNAEIKKLVTSCDLCQRVKVNNTNMSSVYRMVYSSEPQDLVCVDFFGPLPRSTGGMEYIFVVLDVFSKYVRLFPIKRETTDTVLRKLFQSYFPDMGYPRRILSDHGSQFTSPKWGQRLREVGIKVVFSSIRHPQGNPVERVMREIGRLFRTLCADKHTRWARCVSDIEFFLNSTTHMSTGFCPLELHFGKKPKDQIFDIVKFPEGENVSGEAKIVLARERLKKSFERRAKTQKSTSRISLQVGDLVLLQVPKQSDALKKVTSKFFHIFYGPYEILRDFNNGSFELGDHENRNRIIGIYHQINLKKYIKNEYL